jgi:nucleotide-binding universal stress UspA family protein
MNRIHRILHPSDFSRASNAAFAKAVDMAKTNRAELVLAHVMAPVVPMTGDGYVSPDVYAKLEASAREYAQKQLGMLIAKAKKAGVRARALLLEGTPYEQITRAAQAKRVDLVVLGTHGRTGLARFFLGSVASRVVATATCPVLTVRGK